MSLDKCCSLYSLGQDRKPEDCTGMIDTMWISDTILGPNFPEGVIAQVCPRTSWLGRSACFGNGSGVVPDSVTLHRSTPPTTEEVIQIVNDNWDW